MREYLRINVYPPEITTLIIPHPCLAYKLTEAHEQTTAAMAEFREAVSVAIWWI